MRASKVFGLALGALTAVAAACGTDVKKAPEATEVVVVDSVLGAEGPLVVDGNLYYVGWISNALFKWDGKTSTVLQVMTVIWVVLGNYVQASSWRLTPAAAWATSVRVLSWFYVATLAFTIVSGCQYVVRGFRQMFPGRRT